MAVYSIVPITYNKNLISILMQEGVQKQENIYTINNLNELTNKVKHSDKVIVNSIRTFNSVSTMSQAFMYFTSKGVSFKSIHEQKLNFTLNHPLKDNYYKYIVETLKNEQFSINKLEYEYKGVDIEKMIRVVQLSLLYNLVKVFANDGILRR